MPNNKLNFTKPALTKIPPAADGKRDTYHDESIKSLKLIVTDKGTKTFYVYRKVDGKPERIRLGAFPDLSVENARTQAQKVNGEIALGKNPNQMKRQVRTEQRLGALFDMYMERHAKPHKRSWKEDQRQFESYLTHWKDKKISAIKRTDVETLHLRLGEEHGKYTANRVLALLSTVFNKAIDWGWEGNNPTTGIKKFKEKSRERFLQVAELKSFFDALERCGNPDFRDFFYICILTGARKSNVLAMRWQDLDLEAKTWRIPETKNDESYIVAISQEAGDILSRRAHLSESSPWVFPSEASQSGHLVEPKATWRKILKRSGLQDLRIHDLRRTLGSWQAAAGANSYVIGKSLGHKSQHATAIYARLNLDPVRESIEQATKAMMGVKDE